MINESNERYYSQTWITLGAILGGPFAPAYMLASNFKSLGHHKQHLLTLIIGMMLGLGFVYLGWALPIIHGSKINTVLYLFVPLVVTQGFYRLFQASDIEKSSKTTPVHTAPTSLMITIGGLLATVLVFLFFKTIHFMFIDDGVAAIRKNQIEYCQNKSAKILIKSDVDQMYAYAIYQACLGIIDDPYARHLWKCTNKSVARIKFDPKTLTITNKEEVAQISRDCINEFKK